MNHKQKLGYMALGAGVLALGIIIGQWVTPNIEAQHNGVFDKITCRKLWVVDDNGKAAIVLSSDKERNAVDVYDEQGNPAVSLGSTSEAHSLLVFDEQGDQAVSLGSASTGNSVLVHDKQVDPAITLLSSPVANSVFVRNKLTGEVKMLD